MTRKKLTGEFALDCFSFFNEGPELSVFLQILSKPLIFLLEPYVPANRGLGCVLPPPRFLHAYLGSALFFWYPLCTRLFNMIPGLYEVIQYTLSPYSIHPLSL